MSILALTTAIAAARFLPDRALPLLFAETAEQGSAARFEPSSPAIVREMLKLAAVTSRDVVYDLGCGDGRIVTTAAEATGARGTGVDIDPDLIMTSRKNANAANVSDLVRFRHEDLFSTDISKATVVMLYLSPDANMRLRPKLLKELKPGSRIVSHTHGMGDWQPDRKSRVENHEINFWTVPADVSGRWKLEVSDKYAGDYILAFAQNFQKVEASILATGTSLPAAEAAVKGKKIEFRIERELGSLGPIVEFSGEVDGGTINGRFRSAKHSGPWRATRIKEKK
jgi:SAM-dependent methyltransferase